jgi:hypothetical protein
LPVPTDGLGAASWPCCSVAGTSSGRSSERTPKQRCCATPAPKRWSPTCAGTSSGRRKAATPPSSRPPHRSDLGSIDAGGATKLAEAADRYEFTRFVLSSVVGADRPERCEGAVREFLAAKQYAERRLAKLELPWTILRFGQLTENPGGGRIDTVVRAGAPLTTSRDVSALAITEALARRCRWASRRLTTHPTIPR